MRTPGIQSLLVAMNVWVLASCGESRRTGTSDSLSDSAAASRSAPPSRAAAASWAVSQSGIGPVTVGMRVDELQRAAGDIAPAPSGGDCEYVRPAGLPNGVSIMLVRGAVARIDVDSGGVRTNDGAGVGDTESRVRQLYSAQIRALPHKYVPGGSYLIVAGSSPGDSSYRIVFETENGRVTRYRAGRVPEVEWVERCG